MPSPGGSGLDELVDAVDPVVDAALAEPFESAAAYRSAVAEVRSAATAYYSGPDLVMDDGTYDALMARVAADESAHPRWKVDASPTEVVSAGAGFVGDIVHSSPMLSLDNVFGEDALRKWAARLERLLGQPAGGYTVEPKIDGLAIAVRYVDGRLALAATRGDGRAGEDMTGLAPRAAGCQLSCENR
jgi:DNA ligase (NAD+)